jgi:hypothetical protein
MRMIVLVEGAYRENEEPPSSVPLKVKRLSEKLRAANVVSLPSASLVTPPELEQEMCDLAPPEPSQIPIKRQEARAFSLIV